ncbi:hypothetical protein D3C75_1300990 [compost metagenome]
MLCPHRSPHPESIFAGGLINSAKTRSHLVDQDSGHIGIFREPFIEATAKRIDTHITDHTERHAEGRVIAPMNVGFALLDL